MDIKLAAEIGKIGKSDEFKAAMRDFYLAPHSCIETAKHFHMSATGARKILAQLGILRPQFGFPPGVEEKIISMWDQGHTLARIERELGVDENKVRTFFKRRGVTKFKRNSGKNHPNWTGGRYIDAKQYIKVWIAPEDIHFGWAGPRSDVFEHRLVMSRHLNRPLEKSETVHHIDGNTMNNVIGNLQLHQGKHSRGAKMICLCCGSEKVGFAPLKVANGDSLKLTPSITAD